MSTTLKESIAQDLADGWEIHYAPLAGYIAVMRGKEFRPLNSWSEHHELMAEFLRMQQAGEIVHKRKVEWGHVHFHGHRGLVDIWGIKP